MSNHTELLLNERQAALVLQLSPARFTQLARSNDAPPAVKLGHVRLYRRSALAEWQGRSDRRGVA